MTAQQRSDKRKIDAGIERTIRATSTLELSAEGKALSFLVKSEKKYTGIVNDLRKAGDDPEAIQAAIVRLRTTQVEIDAVLARNSAEWSRAYVPRSYLIGRKNVEIPLRVVSVHDRNVRSLLAVFENFTFDDETNELISGGFRVAQESFDTWNTGTADWLGEEFAKARADGIPVGNYSDIGTTRDTLTNRLYKEPNRLRGRTFLDKNGKTVHIPAERTALNLARVEMDRVSNEAAEIEATRIGLKHVYNANPEDSETTDVCQAASDAGVLPKEEMIAEHGRPPRLDVQFHFCRSKLVYVRPEWVE